MRKLKVLVAAVVLATASLTVSVGPVFAATQGSCSGADPTRLMLGEAPNGAGDNLWSCGNATSLPSHTLSGLCDTFNVWNDCASRVLMYNTDNLRFCAYTGTSYTGTVIMSTTSTQIGVPVIGSDLTGAANNSWSSHRWISTMFGC